MSLAFTKATGNIYEYLQGEILHFVNENFENIPNRTVQIVTAQFSLC